MGRAKLVAALGFVFLAVGCAGANDSAETARGDSDRQARDAEDPSTPGSEKSGEQGISKDGHPDRLVGTWQITVEGVDGTVSYEPDGTWESTVDMKIAGKLQRLTSAGTWRVESGAIHNVTTKSDMPGLATPYTSIEKLVSLDDREYRYVCPVAGTTNRMVKVDDDR